MPQPRVLILRAPGTNCDEETAFAFERAGGASERWHVNRLLERPDALKDFQVLCLPGGFSYGDDLGAGRILGQRLRQHLAGAMQDFKASGKLILGICNGFQILIKSGLLLADDPQTGPPATLTWNESGQYTDRWVELISAGSECVFFQGIERMYLPIAHAEGNFVPRDRTTLEKLQANRQVALRYAVAGAAAGGVFPANPNGAVDDIAAVCDPTGRVCGLMPHPERYIDRTQHPRWTRESLPEIGDGLRVFENAVRYFA
jgi:phosphoribosylformylglycinamidine synthase subunit PurQ / glutaminase